MPEALTGRGEGTEKGTQRPLDGIAGTARSPADDAAAILIFPDGLSTRETTQT